jgi:uncharacterized protein
MELEWDEEKRNDGLARHGVDFADVVTMDFSTAITIADKRRYYGEERLITYGRVNGRLHVLCWTRRNDRMRIISFRKANDREEKCHPSPA